MSTTVIVRIRSHSSTRFRDPATNSVTTAATPAAATGEIRQQKSPSRLPWTAITSIGRGAEGAERSKSDEGVAHGPAEVGKIDRVVGLHGGEEGERAIGDGVEQDTAGEGG